jgi:hypothetical protein
MEQTNLIPRNARVIPSLVDRVRCGEIVQNNPKDKFDNIQDWFFFIHIDPVQRFIHSFGMIMSLPFYGLMFYTAISREITWTILYYLIATFFFYVLGIISHYIYDYAQAKSEPKNFLATFPTIIRINLKTLLGSYDLELREFVKKYPFTVTEHELFECPKSQIIGHLFSPQDIDTTPSPAHVGKESEA